MPIPYWTVLNESLMEGIADPAINRLVSRIQGSAIEMGRIFPLAFRIAMLLLMFQKPLLILQLVMRLMKVVASKRKSRSLQAILITSNVQGEKAMAEPRLQVGKVLAISFSSKDNGKSLLAAAASESGAEEGSE